LEPEERKKIATKLHSTAIHLLRTLRTQDATLGIGPAQLSALSVVVFGGPISLGGLSKSEQVRPPTMSRIVEGLVQHKLVRRDSSKEDRRVVMISATEKGARLMYEGQDRRVQKLVRLLGTLSEDDIQQLEKATAILSGVLV